MRWVFENVCMKLYIYKKIEIILCDVNKVNETKCLNRKESE